MNDYSIIEMTEEHIEEVLEISSMSFPIPWSRESFLKELLNMFAKYFVAVKDNEVIGYGGMWIIIDESHITNIAVHPDYRGMGVGENILKSMIHQCSLQRVNAMTLEVRKSNIPAQNLYRKYGFAEEGIRKAYYEDNHEDAIIMWKYY
ncbi:ribosomal protein S18-alanine N-acetyltransferase [Clostridium polynesiense]|uniref:ribosomal protein S18-alanine N-acetyltransferase n=1 Tax=Clostridium polynesiense TaxID=1325933 RepID=UPI00058CD662|nr:ribosomal protein S18-alanine N-acetyltransferase [Clostridium polynesiense]